MKEALKDRGETFKETKQKAYSRACGILEVMDLVTLNKAGQE